MPSVFFFTIWQPGIAFRILSTTCRLSVSGQCCAIIPGCCGQRESFFSVGCFLCFPLRFSYVAECTACSHTSRSLYCAAIVPKEKCSVLYLASTVISGLGLSFVPIDLAAMGIPAIRVQHSGPFCAFVMPVLFYVPAWFTELWAGAE